jgi:deazaflavin-dependent oxidoreductase (nitroreductase family)
VNEALDVAGALAAVADDDFCYLTTRGRVTGQPHEIEIWFAVHDTTLYLLSGGRRGSDWVANLAADHHVTVRLRDTTWAARARIVDPDDAEDERARDLVHTKYTSPSDDLLEWRASALPVALDVEGLAQS